MEFPLRKHGMTRTPTYWSWQAAKARCTNPAHAKFSDYGGRGIAMCEKWSASFEAFLVDMGERPEGTTLDRIDGRLGYEPGNCRWATPQTQSLNQVDRVFYEWRGQRLTIKDIANSEGIPRTSLNNALAKGCGIDAAIEAVKARQGQTLAWRNKNIPHRGEAHGRAKLTEAQVLEIRASEGKCRDLAEQYGVSKSLISYIKQNKGWAAGRPG
jgi:hypothetical protein